MEGSRQTTLDMTEKELKNLRNELWIVLPYFLSSLIFFIFSFQYVAEAAAVPMLISAGTSILTGMRLFHIIFPWSKIGAFQERGLAGEFDHIKKQIEQETLKGHYEEPESKEVTSYSVRKAFLALIGCLLIFLLFGYIVGSFLAIIGASYYYNYKEKLPIAVVLVAVFIIVYVILYKLLEAPEDFGFLLTPLLDYFHLI